MLSKQAQDVLDVLKTEPIRCWTAAAISAKLKCTPDVARGRLKRLCEAGHAERVCEGEYRIVSEAKKQQQAAPADAAPINTPEIRVTDLMQEQLLGALRVYGQPLQPSTLAGRLKRSGFNLHAVTATAAVLVSADKLRRLDDGKLSLPAWKIA